MTNGHERVLVAPTAWRRLNVATLELACTLALLVGSVSLAAAATGDPETTATVAATGVAVVLLGIALVKLFDHLETNGVPLVE